MNNKLFFWITQLITSFIIIFAKEFLVCKENYKKYEVGKRKSYSVNEKK